MSGFQIFNNSVSEFSNLILPNKSIASILGLLTYNSSTNKLVIQDPNPRPSSYSADYISIINGVSAIRPNENISLTVSLVAGGNTISISPFAPGAAIAIGDNLCMISNQTQLINGQKIFSNGISGGVVTNSQILSSVNNIVVANAFFNNVGIINVTNTPTNGQILVATSSTTATWQNNTIFDTGIITLNGLTPAVQTFSTGTTGTDFNIVNSGSNHAFNIPDASLTARGLITTGTQTFGGNKLFLPVVEFNTVVNSTIKMSNTFALRNSTGSVSITNSLPLNNQVLTAIDASHASWQTPTFGNITILETTNGGINASAGLTGTTNYVLIQNSPSTALWQLPVADFMFSVTGQDWVAGMRMQNGSGDISYTGNSTIPFSSIGTNSPAFQNDPFGLFTIGNALTQCNISPGTGPLSRKIKVDFSSSVVTTPTPVDINARYQVELWIGGGQVAILCIINGAELFNVDNSETRVQLNGFHMDNYGLSGNLLYELKLTISGSDGQFHNLQFGQLNVQYTMLAQ